MRNMFESHYSLELPFVSYSHVEMMCMYMHLYWLCRPLTCVFVNIYVWNVCANMIKHVYDI